MTDALRTVVAVVAVAALAGCGPQAGTDASAERGRSERLVNFSKDPPYVNGLEVEPGSGHYLLTTNRGFWDIDPRTDAVKRVRGSITADGKKSTVGTFLTFAAIGPGRLLGSGHPDQKGTLPPYLGLIASNDGGRTWSTVSRLGEADLHKIVLRHGRLYGFDAVLGAMLTSRDGGRTFEEQFTPRGLIIDFVVDPGDPERIFAATERELFRSEDGGRGWRPAATGDGMRLAWPAPDAFYRADRDGTVQRSRDGGRSWQPVGRVDGEPYKLKALAPEHVLVALSDGTIAETRDGGRTWEEVFKP